MAIDLTREEIIVSMPLAMRRLGLRDQPGERITVALYGPFDMPDNEVVFFTIVDEPGNSAKLSTPGDSMFALSRGIEMCRLHLLHLVRRYGDRLVYEDGEGYDLLDVPQNSVRRNQLLE